MYFQSDTVLRMIEQLGAFYRRIMDMMSLEERKAEGEMLIGAEFLRLTGLEMNTALSLSPDALYVMLGGRGAEERVLAASELLRMHAMLLGEDDFPDDARIASEMEMSAALLAELGPGAMGFAEERLSLLLAKGVYVASDKLFRFFMEAGAYARAEDALDIALEEGVLTHEDARAFYLRLLEMSKDSLSRGNFTREEALAGLERLGRL